MGNLSEHDWRDLAERQYLDSAQAGYIGVDFNADEEWCHLAMMLTRQWLACPTTKPAKLVLMIYACRSGCAHSWDLAEHYLSRLPGLETRTRYEATSAGLLLFLAGERRIAHPAARFGFHGNVYLPWFGALGNEERATWFASRTQRDFAWWMARCEQGSLYEFGAAEALDIGVATEVAE
jgi:hypothetical protein